MTLVAGLFLMYPYFLVWLFMPVSVAVNFSYALGILAAITIWSIVHAVLNH